MAKRSRKPEESPDDLVGYLEWRKNKWSKAAKKSKGHERARFSRLASLAEKAHALVGSDNVLRLPHYEKATIDNQLELMGIINGGVLNVSAEALEAHTTLTLGFVIGRARYMASIK